MILGKCPFCGGNVLSQKITARGQKINLYHCEHAIKERDVNDDYVFSATSMCRFQVYSNALLRWNKRSLSELEMKTLLQEGQIVVRLHGKKGTREYFKYVVADPEYGVSILWDSEVA
ncbi:hypothetical protein [Sulfurospirillum deleyianum]|uniref:Uncharacterized protein n=1 Tax=Sulfurospirillum deleyianum (strain ATCC 51133 / DSM 6946 / 5175) TaxID=525898 RepID=D1AZA1_SULD5|nr:hypothetical protein [Sulfurospirillum deleyianum]ACZ11368.1 conserved hypothetical protein [Sulfurospirillum deleyianum DSM 6946]